MDLLDDLNALSDEETQDFEEENEEKSENSDVEMESTEIDKYLLDSIQKAHDIHSITKVYNSSLLQETLSKVRNIDFVKQDSLTTFGAIEEDPEYKLILSSNDLIAAIDNEQIIIHKYVRDHYSPRFPELDSLLPRPIDYIKTVGVIGNQIDKITNLDLKTQCELPQSSIMIVTVASTTSIGRPLSEDEIAKVNEASSMYLDLESYRQLLMNYVESRMTLIAPNLSMTIGSSVAAKLMGAAGGLSALSKIPACNLQVLGKTAKTNTGLSALGIQKHVGFIFHSDLVSGLPSDYRKKANRLIAAKCALAVRIDISRESMDGSAGKTLRQEIERRIEKLLEPPAGKSIKALRIPDEAPKKRRAGKKARKMKERYATSELGKLQNRMAFGVIAEEEIGGSTGMTQGLGLIGASTGKIRNVAADKKLKVGLSKKYKAITGTMTSSSGLSSSLAFTPVQGLELENPETQKQKIDQLNEKWFAGSFKKKSQ